MRKRMLRLRSYGLLFLFLSEGISVTAFLSPQPTPRPSFRCQRSGNVLTNMSRKNTEDESITVDTETTALSLAQAKSLQEQAAKLKQEALAMREQLDDEKEQALVKRNAKIDGWIDELLIQMEIGATGDDDDEDVQVAPIQLLKTVEQVLERLQEDRYSQEQINAIFNRICETGPKQSRSNCSPIMELLVDAVGKMDEVERAENPNKRWSGRVERVLRRRLFAMDWNMDIDDESEDDDMNPWLLR